MKTINRFVSVSLFQFFFLVWLALTPSHFNHDESEEEEHHDTYIQPTNPPPVRSTTLRTIIKPESEVYHSNSGIQVTFNTESKHQNGHEFQENYEESVVQPIVTDARPSPPNEHHQHHHHHHHQQQQQNRQAPLPPSPQQYHQPSLAPNHQFNNNERARAFEIQYNNHVQNSAPVGQPTYHHRFAPPQQVSHASQPPFLKPTPDQGLLLSYTQNQANRLYQTQNYNKNHPTTGQQNHRFTDPSLLSFSPPHNAAPIKFRNQPVNHQPKPIPIPLHHHHDKGGQSAHPTASQQVNHHPHYTNYKQFQRPKTQSHQNVQFQQSFPQPVTGGNAVLNVKFRIHEN